VDKNSVFGVNVLRADHQGLADQFAGRLPGKSRNDFLAICDEQ
jgi:hypothetical protein